MKIAYLFPIVHLEESDPECSQIMYDEACVTPIRLNREPYEAVVEARGYSFHILFGSQQFGNFLCIPDHHTGCELAAFNDKPWNTDSILHADSGLDYEDATAIVYALSLLNEYINNETIAGA